MKLYYTKVFLLISLITTINSCEKEDDSINTPNIFISIGTTNENAEKTFTSIKINGEVTTQQTNPIISRGVCWSSSPNPTIENSLIIETDNVFTSIANDLLVNTIYYFRTFVTNEDGTLYSEEQAITTLSLNNTSWKVSTIYPSQNNFEIYSRVDLYEDNTTKFNELDLPGQCPDCFITFGSWTLDGNNLTYIWQGANPNTSTYVYTGIISGMTIQGTYTHQSEPDGTWQAVKDF